MPTRPSICRTPAIPAGAGASAPAVTAVPAIAVRDLTVRAGGQLLLDRVGFAAPRAAITVLAGNAALHAAVAPLFA